MEQSANHLKQKLIEHPDYIRALDDLVKRPAIQVALTGYCNFNCVYCSTRLKKKKQVNMSMALVERIIEDCSAWKINPWFGQTYEPFLHPKIVSVITQVNSAELFFTASTNGSCFSPAVYALPMNLTISVSENEKDYAYRKSPVSFERYMKSLTDFVSHRIRHAIPGVMTFQFADYHMLETGDEMYDKRIMSIASIADKMERFAGFLGIGIKHDRHILESDIEKRTPISVYDDGSIGVRFVSTRIMPGIKDVYAGRYVETEGLSGYCDSCYHIMSIQADGGIACCCCDPQANTVFHRMTPDEHLQDIWMGEAITLIRKSFKEKRPIMPFCHSCLEPVSDHIKPLLTCFRKDIVRTILHGLEVYNDQPWFEFD